MQYPYQCLQICGNTLIAASTSHLETFRLGNGAKLYSCSLTIDSPEKQTVQSLPDSTAVALSSHISEASSAGILAASEPPNKRRKFSDEDTLKSAAEGISTQSSTKHSGTAQHKISAINIVALVVTKNERHVIAVTGEDKAIRVLEHDGDGHLQEISKRVMPKRPCAIALTEDDSTVVCADKFGDVYSLPLLPNPSLLGVGPDQISLPPESPEPASRKPFVSAANDLTIHTARNRRALQNQLRQDQRQSEKADIKFEHNLLLGHVSMLTDVCLTKGEGRSYIITADRDEHIRVSRGIPQAHITENYCLGHDEFVTQLCLPPTHPSLLISGGGDDDIYIWKWSSGKLLQKVDLLSHVEKIGKIDKSNAEQTGPNIGLEPVSLKLAVSTIRHIVKREDEDFDTIVVTCEAVPALFFFFLSHDGSMTHYYTAIVNGNPLSIAVDEVRKKLVVSVDCVHKSGSTTDVREDTEFLAQPLQIFNKEGSTWVAGTQLFQTEGSEILVKGEPLGIRHNLPNLTNLLYSLQNLRKRGGEE